MKKVILVCIIAVSSLSIVSAQPRAIGGRIGVDLEASYQHSIGSKKYLQLDLGLPGYAYGVQGVVTFNTIFATPHWGSYGKWEWFAGGGVGAGMISGGYYYYENAVFIGGAGNIGLSFTFPFDLQLSAEYRPLLGPAFGKRSDGDYIGFYGRGLFSTALAVRYAF